MEKNSKTNLFLFQDRAREEPCYFGKIWAVKEKISGKDFETFMKYQGNIQKKQKKTYLSFFNLFSDWIHKIYQHQGGRDQEDRGRGEEEQGGAASTGELNLSVWSWYWLLVSSFEISIEQVQLWALHFPKRLFRSISTSRPWPCCWWPGPQSRQSSSSPK